MTAPRYMGRVSEAENEIGIDILSFTARANKNCAVCGVHFKPTYPWHELCRQCWSYNRIGHACARFNARPAV